MPHCLSSENHLEVAAAMAGVKVAAAAAVAAVVAAGLETLSSCMKMTQMRRKRSLSRSRWSKWRMTAKEGLNTDPGSRSTVKYNNVIEYKD